ncbi:unnamed protein product, partial [Scytosiphon promiscuus]
MSQPYEARDETVARLEGALAFHRQQLAEVNSSAQQKQHGEKNSSSSRPSIATGNGPGRQGGRKERSPREAELYRTYRLYLLQSRQQRQEEQQQQQQQRQPLQEQPQQMPSREPASDAAALVRQINAGLSQTRQRNRMQQKYQEPHQPQPQQQQPPDRRRRRR